MILWDGLTMHDPERYRSEEPQPEGCWGDRRGEECGEPPVLNGLCGDCLARLTGERPACVLQPTPPSAPFITGSGRR